MAGRQVIIDGNILDPTTQLLLRGMELMGEGEISRGEDVAENRANMRRQAGLLQFSTPVGQVRNFSIPSCAAPSGSGTTSRYMITPGPCWCSSTAAAG